MLLYLNTCTLPEMLEQAIGTKVLETCMVRDLLVVVKIAETLAQLTPDFMLLKQFDQFFGFIITAKGDDCDFVSRFYKAR
jgi:hypothetical protein